MNESLTILNKEETYRKTVRMSTSQLASWLSRFVNIDADDLASMDRTALVGGATNFRRGIITLDELTTALNELYDQLDAPAPALDTEPSLLDELKVQAKANKATYETVNFPLSFRSDGLFQFAGGTPFVMTYDGLGYVCYRLAQFLDVPAAVHSYYTGDYEALVDAINVARIAQQASKCRAGRRNEFVQITVNGRLVALLTTYKPVSNLAVLEAIEEAGLKSRVKWGEVELHRMRVYIRSEYADADGRAIFGALVRNGETGRQMLAYNAYVSIDDYEFIFPTRAAKRHLGSVAELATDLKTVYVEAVAIETAEYLKAQPAIMALGAIRDTMEERFDDDKVAELIARTGGTTAMDAIASLSAGSREHGWKTISTAAIDAIFEWGCKQVTS